MTLEERKLALYCLKASSDYHSEVCEECIKYPNCDHIGQDDVTETIIKALEQQPCETIKEIPKDYKYDTETEDFIVYRHKYTGHEIHIEKPVPRYRLEQTSFEDWLSTFNTSSATECFTAIQQLKEKLNGQMD